MRTGYRAAIGLLCALGLFTTGCANNGNGSGTAKDKGKETSPLEKYLGDDGQRRDLSSYARDSGGGMVAAFSVAGGELNSADQAKHRKVENLVAACMRKEGFEYVPIPPRKPEKSKFDQAADLSPADYAKRWGYGIATPMAAGDEMAPEFNDPNEPIRNKLTKKAQKAYDKALHGDMASAETIDAGKGEGGAIVKKAGPGKPGEPGEVDEGCTGEANRKVFGDPEKMMKQETKFQGLLDDIDALRKRMAKDPRMTKAYAAWSDCMADAGHSNLRTPADARESIEKRMMKAFESKQGGDMKKLAKEEIKVATADAGCKDEHVNAAEHEVRTEIETAFVKDNRAELERYKDFRAEQEKSGGGRVVVTR